MVRLEDRECLVAGGGNVAARKVRSLLECGARVTVVSPALTDELADLVREGRISHIARLYRPGDESGAFLVIAATDSQEANASVWRHAAGTGNPMNLLLNVVDDAEHSSFIVPSVLRRGSLTVAVGTEGKSPALSRKLREKLEQILGPEWGALAELLGAAREVVLEKVTEPPRRRRIFEELSEERVLEALRLYADSGDPCAALELLKNSLGGEGLAQQVWTLFKESIEESDG
ncbi:MAG: bifunctional precorrin-2 dehydrogenase/sirohydrochlorin ferrochelatase [Firmicutes bacterium]|nr:bifunctional precorrin-2 dehydrogenase/sirohydrochlorin ferrochelatase [Bacillota bacterium]